MALLSSFVMSGALFAADFSKKSLDELVDLAGKVEPKDVADYRAEVQKRSENMTVKESRDFHDKIKAQRDKVYDSMTVKELKARKAAIKEATGGKMGEKMGKAKAKMEGKMDAAHHKMHQNYQKGQAIGSELPLGKKGK